MSMLSDALAASPNGKKIFLAETTVGNQYTNFQPWLPNFLPGLTLWLRPEELQADYSNGDSIGTWRDASGNGNDFTQPGSSLLKPVYSSNQANGFGVAGFNGSQYLERAITLSGLFSSSAVTMLAVVNQGANNQNGDIFGNRFGSGDSVDVFMGIPDPASFLWLYGSNSTNQLTVSFSKFGGQPEIFCFDLDDSNGLASVKHNGSTFGSKIFSGTLDVTKSGTAYLGSFALDSGRFFNGQLLEFIIFNRKLNFWEEQAVYFYLANKYQLYSSVNINGGLYFVPENNSLYDLQLNGRSLVPVSGLNAVASGALTYYPVSSGVYLNTDNAYPPSGATVQAFYKYLFATEPKILNGNYYQPRIAENGLPQLNMRVEKKFGTVAQIGGGNLTLANNDGYFDALKDYQWDAGTTTILLGYDHDDFILPYSGYQPLATLLNYGINFNNDQDFILNLYELKTRIKKKVALNNYLTDYPRIAEANYGSVKQIAYGKILGAAPVIIDTAVSGLALNSSPACKVADHPIISFDGLRIQSNNNWNTGVFGYKDTSTGEFSPLGTVDPITQAVTYWNGKDAVSVDFTGKPISSGLFTDANLFYVSGLVPSGSVPNWVMDNAADQVYDLLANVLGEKGMDANSFIESHKRLDAGYNVFNGQRSTQARYSLYIDDSKKDTDAFNIIADMNGLVYSTLFIDSFGNYHYKVFQPLQASGLPTFGDESIDNFVEITGDSNYSIVSKTAVTYAQRLSENWGEFIQQETPSNQWTHGNPSPVIDTVNLSTSFNSDANYWQQKDLNINGKQFRTYQMDIYNPSAFSLQVGDQVHIQHKFNTRTNTYFRDVVLNLISSTLDISGPKITVVGTDMHGLRDTTGFWAGDNDKLPAQFAGLQGYVSGDVSPWNPAWHDSIKTYCRQNYGYWKNDLGFVEVSGIADPGSYLAGRWF